MYWHKNQFSSIEITLAPVYGRFFSLWDKQNNRLWVCWFDSEIPCADRYLSESSEVCCRELFWWVESDQSIVISIPLCEPGRFQCYVPSNARLQLLACLHSLLDLAAFTERCFIFIVKWSSSSSKRHTFRNQFGLKKRRCQKATCSRSTTSCSGKCDATICAKPVRQCFRTLQISLKHLFERMCQPISEKELNHNRLPARSSPKSFYQGHPIRFLYNKMDKAIK